MPAIPVNPDLVANAQPYPASYSLTSMNVCRAPPEGAACIPLQFLFNVNTSWLVDLSQGNPAISQISSMYIDNINSATPVIIVFPDTGYEVQVNAGKSLLCPVFTSNTQLPKFYVILDSGGITTADYTNLILLNFFIPEFAAP